MPDIRPIRAEELEEYLRLDAYAFGYEPDEAARSRYQRYLRLEETLATFVEGRMAAHLVAYGWPMAINGGTVPCGAIADVAVWPEDRRGGLAGGLLRACLASMRERGLPLSMLHPSFYALYDRLGWATAAESRTYTFRPSDLRFRSPVATGGRLERLAPDAWQELTPIYEQWLAGGNGSFMRGPAQWEGLVVAPHLIAPARQFIRWRDEQRKAQGYLVHRYPARVGDFVTTLYDQEIQVRELVARTPAAYRALIDYLARHDLAERVRWSAPPDDAFPSLLADPRAVKIETQPDVMLRLVDLVPALEMRPYLPGPPARLVLRVTDRDALWNDGTWLLEVESGKAHVTPSTAEPDLSLNIGTLAALYNSYLTPARAARVGLLEGTNAAVEAATRIFAVSAPPYCLDYF
jgi:predicted acetyltransferase